MEETFTYFTSYGAIGIIAFLLFKNTLQSHKEEREFFIEELNSSRELYKNELAEDRAIYLSSIEKITSSVKELDSKIIVIEDDVKEIKNKLDR